MSVNLNPTVSIGVPVYNGDKYLAQTLDSILGQTFSDFELIISDNASSDGTEAVCREYAARDVRVRYYRSPKNVGMSRNFNRVFQLSRGRYFRWSSADDLFAPTSLESCVDVLDCHPEVVLCYPKTTLIDGEDNVIRQYEDNLNLCVSNAIDRFRRIHANLGLANVQYGLIRSDVLRQTSLFGGYAGSDMVLIAELSLYGQFWEIPQHLFFRRMHDHASSSVKDRSWERLNELWDPTSKAKLDLYHWNHRIHEVNLILRSPVRTVAKIRLICFVIGYAFRSRHLYIKELISIGPHVLRRIKHNLSTPVAKF